MNLFAWFQRMRIVRLRKRLEAIRLEANDAEDTLQDIIADCQNFDRLGDELRSGPLRLGS